MPTFMGIRGSDDWITDQRPKNWRQKMLRLFPNGMMQLTGLTAMMPEEPTDDPEYSWFSKILLTHSGTFVVTEIYTDSILATKYTTGGLAGQVFYLKVAEAVADEFRAGMQALLQDQSLLVANDVHVKVLSVDKNGASSKLTLELMENDTANNMDATDFVMALGNSNPEGDETPDALMNDPTKFFNYTQIFRDTLDITRTAAKQRLRTGDPYMESKLDALEMHGVGMEYALLMGQRREWTGANGQKERTFDGIQGFLQRNLSTNILDYENEDTNYDTKTWIAADGGIDFIERYLEQLFRFITTDEVFALCGSGALDGINKLARTHGTINLEPTSNAFGTKIRTWESPFGQVHFKTHPLMSQQSTLRHRVFLLDPKNIRMRPLDDTKFLEDPRRANKSTNAGRDGYKEEYLTEMGPEFFHPETFMIWDGIGKDNPA